jgi:glycosyltransferase involved in cell wall biosynthesis
MTEPELSVLIPVLNWEETLEGTVRRLRAALAGRDVEVLVVFDITQPEAREEIEGDAARLADEYGTRSLFRLNERGFGSALRFGAQHATGRAVMPVMADLSDDLEAIPAMLSRLASGADVVVGARYVPGGRIVGDTVKQRTSRFYTRLMGLVTEVRCGDASNSFKMYRREVWDAVDPVADSFDLSVELVVKAAELGYRIEHVPVTWENRQAGESKFRVVREVRNYGRWLGYAMLRMPSRWLIAGGLGVPLLLRARYRRAPERRSAALRG